MKYVYTYICTYICQRCAFDLSITKLINNNKDIQKETNTECGKAKEGGAKKRDLSAGN